MHHSGDRPLTRAEETALLVACVFLTPLVAVAAHLYWRGRSPQRAASLLELAAGLARLAPLLLAVAALLLLIAFHGR